MRKKNFIYYIVLVLVISFALSLIACTPDDGGTDDDNLNLSEDDKYSILLRGLVNEDEELLADVSITKAMIKTLFEEKPVIHTSDNPCYASDKTDADGNKIPHTVKGVYLEDILSAYTESAGISAYGALTLNATDGYVTVATEDIFNSQGRGSKAIIVFEYDGILLNTSEKSGALRAVFPDQIANVWAKKLSSIEFSTEILLPPAVNKVYFYESLDESLQDQYTTLEESFNNALVTYYGVSIEKLIEEGILDAQESDKMHLLAWDYIAETESYIEYTAWTKYDVYSGGYLLEESQREDEEIEKMLKTPVFDGPAFNVGMTVKNILAISVFNTSVVCLNTSFTRFDPDAEGAIYTKDILLLLKMYDEDDSYIVTDLEGNDTELTAQQIFASTIEKAGESYVLKYTENGSKTMTISKIAVKI